jgi:osmotically-inducible protein OsmY
MATVTDAEIAARVKNALATDPRLAHLDIEVRSQDGFVVLEGQVDTFEDRERAGEIARAVPGVRGVRNFLVLTPLRRGEREPEVIWVPRWRRPR